MDRSTYDNSGDPAHKHTKTLGMTCQGANKKKSSRSCDRLLLGLVVLQHGYDIRSGFQLGVVGQGAEQTFDCGSKPVVHSSPHATTLPPWLVTESRSLTLEERTPSSSSVNMPPDRCICARPLFYRWGPTTVHGVKVRVPGYQSPQREARFACCEGMGARVERRHRYGVMTLPSKTVPVW